MPEISVFSFSAINYKYLPKEKKEVLCAWYIINFYAKNFHHFVSFVYECMYTRG